MSLEAPARPRGRGIFLVPRSHHLAARRASDRGQPASAHGVTGAATKKAPGGRGQPHLVCPKNDISETPASKKCSLTVGQSNFETDQMKTVVISGFRGGLIFCALIILVWAALGLTSA